MATNIPRLSTDVDGPRRVQRRRTRGWRMPAGAVYVGRDSRWGNPYILGTPENGGNMSRETVRREFEKALRDNRLQVTVDDVQTLLAGAELACWCPLDQKCHADVLLRIANSAGH